MNKVKVICLLLIIFLGGVLRLYRLSLSPPSLNWDEAAWGYNAYSISQTAKDEYGVTLPIFTRSFDEYKSTLPLYLMIPSIKIFGLNEMGVRFPSALVGTMMIILIFLLVMEIFKSEEIALVSAFVFAIEPWSVHFARVYYDANEALFFMMLGLLIFLYSKRKTFLFPFSALCFMVSMYTYNSNKIIIPVLLIGLFLLNRKIIEKYPRKIIITTAVILTFSLLIFSGLAVKGEAFARVSSTNILKLWGSEAKSLNSEHLLSFSSFFLHNKMFYFIWNIVGRYFSYFSPLNLFLREPSEPATIVAGNSVFHPFEFIFWAIGLLYLIKNYKQYKELLLTMLVAPIPAIMTWNWFQPGRAMSLFFVFSILIGVGWIRVVKALNAVFAKIVFCFLFFLGLSSALYLFDSLMIRLPYRDSGNWQPGFRETVPIVYQLSNNYDQVIVESPHAQPYIFYLFYSRYPPSQYSKEIDLNKMGKPRKYYDFGKFKFRSIYWPKDRYLPKTLFVGSVFSLPQDDVASQPNAKVLKEIKDRDGNIITKIVSTD